MAAAGELMTTKPVTDTRRADSAQPEATKEDLQRRMEDARESISQTVGEIRETVEDQYAAVKATVSGFLDWREGFQGDPILWSVGALSAGFAFGYTVGITQKSRKRPGGKASALDTFADSLVQELKNAGARLPLSSLDPKVRAVLGFDLSDLFAAIGRAKTPPPRRNMAAKRKARPSAGRKRR
jgi:hypothetical protein